MPCVRRRNRAPRALEDKEMLGGEGIDALDQFESRRGPFFHHILVAHLVARGDSLQAALLPLSAILHESDAAIGSQGCADARQHRFGPAELMVGIDQQDPVDLARREIGVFLAAKQRIDIRDVRFAHSFDKPIEHSLLNIDGKDHAVGGDPFGQLQTVIPKPGADVGDHVAVLELHRAHHDVGTLGRLAARKKKDVGALGRKHPRRRAGSLRSFSFLRRPPHRGSEK